MSDWTHVAGVVVLDTFNFESVFSQDLPKKEEIIEAFKKYIGPLSPFGSYNRESTLPRGSEGALTYDVHINDSNHNAVVIVNIFGDLRDFSYPKQITDWFSKTFNEDALRDAAILPYIRYAVLTAENDYHEEQHLAVWNKGTKSYDIIINK